MTDATDSAAAGTVAAAVDELVDRYRHRCLWFLRADYYPRADDERLHVLGYIERHGDLDAFRCARSVKQWLLRSSSERSAG